MATPTQTPRPDNVADLEPPNYEQIEAESEDVLFETALVAYQSMLEGYKQTLSRTQVVQQTSNFSGVAGPIYSSQYETTVALQSPTEQQLTTSTVTDSAPDAITSSPRSTNSNMGSY